MERGRGELRLTSLRGRGVYLWPAFKWGDDGVVGRGRPEGADGCGDFGIVNDGRGVSMDGRGGAEGIADFVEPDDCLGVFVGGGLGNLVSPGGTPSKELLETEDALE